MRKKSIQYTGDIPLNETIFRIEEKKFKHNKFLSNEVIDFNNISNCNYKNNLNLYTTKSNKKLYSFGETEGFFILPNYFDIQEQKYWINEALYEYTKSNTYINNIVSLDDTKQTIEYTKDIRWTRLGEQYDWSTVSYDTNKKKVIFPDNLKNKICEIVQEVADLNINNNCGVNYYNYKPEVAFVNYYPVGTGMFAHQDKSELTYDRPLVSISLGCSCIFLIGDDTRDTKPYAFMLRSGDIVFMTGKSRLAFHGVPKIFDDLPKELHDIKNMDKLRININVRQVYE